MGGDLRVAKALCRRGANWDALDNGGRTALEYAITGNHYNGKQVQLCLVMQGRCSPTNNDDPHPPRSLSSGALSA